MPRDFAIAVAVPVFNSGRLTHCWRSYACDTTSRLSLIHIYSTLASAKAASVCLRAQRNVAQNAKPVSVSSKVSVMK